MQLCFLMGQELGQVLVQVPLQVPFEEEIGGKVHFPLRELWWVLLCFLMDRGQGQVLVQVPFEEEIGGKERFQLREL